MPTTTEAARILNCHKSTVTRAAKRYQIGSRHGPLLAFTAEDIERLREVIRDGPGHPDFGREGAKGGRAKAAKAKASRRGAGQRSRRD